MININTTNNFPLSNEKRNRTSFTSKNESHLNGVISIEDHPITFDDKL